MLIYASFFSPFLASSFIVTTVSCFVAQIINLSDQQASIFLQQKLKVADLDKRVDVICTRGFKMMAHRYQKFDRLEHNEHSLLSHRFGQSKDVLRLHQLSMRDERSFLHEVHFKLPFILVLHLHFIFLEGGLLILPLIVMAVTSYKRHSIVRKRHPSFHCLGTTPRRSCPDSREQPCLAHLEQVTLLNCRAMRSAVFTATLLDYGIVLDSAACVQACYANYQPQ